MIYLRSRKLDTPRSRHYVAPDFEGIKFLFVPGRSEGTWVAEPRDNDRLVTGSEGRKATADLGARIARARGQRTAEAAALPERHETASGLSIAWRLMSEFVAAIIVGAGLGYLADMFLPTRPWGLIVMLLLGFAAGVLNVVRAANEMNRANAVPPGTPAVPDDDDD